jgi:hypothetical protein
MFTAIGLFVLLIIPQNQPCNQRCELLPVISKKMISKVYHQPLEINCQQWRYIPSGIMLRLGELVAVRIKCLLWSVTFVREKEA